MKQCNIDKTDRINRIVIGALLLIAAIIGMGKLFFILVGVILIVEGIIGWCYIPTVVKNFTTKKKTDQTK